jgi:hypothetical protein
LEDATGLHFERRNAPAPELPGIKAVLNAANRDTRPPKDVLKELHGFRNYFAGFQRRGEQTHKEAKPITDRLALPILRSENARTPGLNAIDCPNTDKMVAVLRYLSKKDGNQEGHVRFHLGLGNNAHRIAVDAFRHREGGFTLVAVDSMGDPDKGKEIATIQKSHPDLIKGALTIPTPNQLHIEGCHIFGIHNLNALHDFQPYVQGLHRQLYDAGRGKPTSLLSDPRHFVSEGNAHYIKFVENSFIMLPGKFFKHMQVMKPEPGKGTVLDLAENQNPSLNTHPLNKQGQTLRQRFASQNPDKATEEFSRADRTASLDKKRLVLIDRAIGHYMSIESSEKASPF